MDTVRFDLINRIRQHINRTEKQVEILPNRMRWNKLTSALDVLEDSSWAIEYYLESDYPKEMKGKYLYTYGLLQALFVQQDAVNSLNIALLGKKIDFQNDYPYANAVRDIRNDTIGHPTNRGGNKFISIAQMSMTKNGFYYCKDDGEDRNKDEIIDVNIMKSIEDTAKCINEIIKKAVDDLDSEYKEYIEKHRDRKMQNLFNGLDYARSKVFEETALRNSEYNSTKKMIEECEKELILRYGSIEAKDGYKWLLSEIHELYDLIDSVPEICNLKKDRIRYYLLDLLFNKLEELRDYCKETDKYFENFGETIIDTDNESERVTVNIVLPDGSNAYEESSE